MSTNAPPPVSPPPPSPSGGGGKGPLIALVAVLALAGVVVGVIQARKQTAGVPEGPTWDERPSPPPEAPPRPAPRYASLDRDLSPDETPELVWLEVRDPPTAHDVLKKNPWLDKAMKEPVGQGFLAAWGGFFGTRGEDLGKVFSGAVADLALDQLLRSPYRVVWYGGDAAKGSPAVVVTGPAAPARTAFDALVKAAASGGYNPPACVGAKGPAAEGEAVEESIHRLVLADKVVFAAKLADRLVFSPRPEAVQLALCKPLETVAARPGVAVSLGFSLDDGGRGTQTLGTLLGVDGRVFLDFGVVNGSFAPKGLSATSDGVSRLVAVEPSPELLKAVPERSGVVLFVGVKLPKDLSATALRDTLAPPDKKLQGRRDWPQEARQLAVVWNPRGTRSTEVAVLWGTPGDEPAIAAAMKGGHGRLLPGKACSVLAYASTPALLEELQATCAGKKPSLLQAAPPVVKGLSAKTSVSLTVNLGRIASQLTLDGWFSEHPAPNQNAGPQEIESARRLLEELPTLGFRATLEADGTLVPGGFKS